MDTEIDRGLLIRDADRCGFVRSNKPFRAATGLDEATLASRPLLEWLAPAHREAAKAVLDRREGRCRVEHLTRTGATVALELRIQRQGEQTVVLGRIPREKELDADAVEAPLEATVSGTLDTIAHIVEEQNPGYRCSILLVRDGRFVKGAGPSLPDDYNAAIDGYAVGPTVGSCGTAIYWNVPVIVEDIQADPLWLPFAELAAGAGVAACWSHPFTSSNGRVLGAIALYAPEPRAPTPEQLSRLRAAARMTGLAVERGRAEEALRLQRIRERELEEQLRQASKLEALGVLAGGVAHDFNNVLHTILTNAEFALAQTAPGSQAVDCLRDIVSASQRASGFCRQMLDYAGRGSYKPALFDLRELVPQVRTLAQAALAHSTRLLFELPEDPVYIHGDESQLLRVLLNLVTNATQATGLQGGAIIISVASRSLDREAVAELAPAAPLPPGEYCLLVVEDDGCGMDEETAARIFDPFFSTRSSGRGLGLAAVQGIITRHGGAIRLRTSPGQGTTFTLLLPLSPDQPRYEAPSRDEPPAIVPQRLLLAEDNHQLRRALCRHLRHHGFEVAEASDGLLAIELFEAAPASFDCALLDYNMPERNGLEVLGALREHRPDLPVLLMTGMAAEGVVEGSTLAGDTRVLQKPIVTQDLLDEIVRATKTSR